MKVCAWINSAPFQNDIHRFDSVSEAIEYFRDRVAYWCKRDGLSTDENGYYVMDLYPQCDECEPMMNFHDYPMSRYSVGPRGDIRKECV